MPKKFEIPANATTEEINALAKEMLGAITKKIIIGVVAALAVHYIVAAIVAAIDGGATEMDVDNLEV